ncbi:MAG: nucleotidyltransferase family protein, partial [Pseudomonadota bacterium]
MSTPAHPQAAMVFAAGFGTRMAPLTNTCPKPLISVAGRPLLAHALEALTPAKLARTVINTHYMAEQIADWVSSQARNDLLISHEVRLLDTGGGMRHAQTLLQSGPVVTMNSDAVWDRPAAVEPLLQAWDPQRMDVLLLVVDRQNAVGHSGSGDFNLDPQGRLERRGSAACADYVYTGASITHLDLLADEAEP